MITNHETAVSLLSSTPPLLKGWLENLPREVLRRSEQKNSWNSIEIIKHLIHGEQTDWIPRIKLMLEKNKHGVIPTFSPYNREGFKQILTDEISDLTLEFQKARSQSIEEIIHICQINDLNEIKGIHPALGKVNGAQLVATWIVHDQTHIYQIARNVSSIYAKDVGPWAEYLRIVN